jgi:hypothetical protein
MSKSKHIAAILAVGGALAAIGARGSHVDVTMAKADPTAAITAPDRPLSPHRQPGDINEVDISYASGDASGADGAEFDTGESGDSLHMLGGLDMSDLRDDTSTVSRAMFSPGLLAGQEGRLGGPAVATAAVPEPGTWALMVIGLLGLGAVQRALRGKVAAA